MALTIGSKSVLFEMSLNSASRVAADMASNTTVSETSDRAPVTHGIMNKLHATEPT
eukprot:CAMPEP_0197542686 /NCGR_PEP_ID=MMETSP1318-20131121/67839_1 /TAXON_ID=552666 /ORGANISM="Partenskyella glossopodia, Strain RCC365" /LENGTH=55 /DNA_ID=CAMNT_0043101971 /DNA_START=343 /DNA_END=510 /DNA_ORIENTATION=-